MTLRPPGLGSARVLQMNTNGITLLTRMGPTFGQYVLNSDNGHIQWWNGQEWEFVHDTGFPQVLDIVARFGGSGGGGSSPRPPGQPGVDTVTLVPPLPSGPPIPQPTDNPIQIGGGDTYMPPHIGGGGGLPPRFLIAYMAWGISTLMPTDLSTHPWTLAWVNQDIGAASVIACGAGPPTGQNNAMWYRAIAPGETTTVATFKSNGAAAIGMWVFEISGIDLANILIAAHSRNFSPDGAAISVSAVLAVKSIIFGGVSWAEDSSDGGWCEFPASPEKWGPGHTPAPFVIGSVGTQLVNASGENNCGGFNAPWSWIAYKEGIGATKIEAVSNSNGNGAGAYICGYNIGRGALILPVATGATFGIVQSAWGGDQISQPFDVVLPFAPTP